MQNEINSSWVNDYAHNFLKENFTLGPLIKCLLLSGWIIGKRVWQKQISERPDPGDMTQQGCSIHAVELNPFKHS